MHRYPKKQGTGDRVLHQFDAFCRLVISNESKNQKRRLYQRKDHEVLQADASQENVRLDIYVTDNFSVSVEAAVIEILSERLFDALMQLPRHQQDTILLFFWKEYSCEKIACMLGVTPRTVARIDLH